MIVVLSMNTAVDRFMLVPNFAPGDVYRAQETRYVAGGKALNVARVLRRLGEPVRVVGTLGGMPRDFIRTWCDGAGVDGRWVEIAAESRTCIIVLDPTSGRETVLNDPGPTLSPGEIGRVERDLDRSVEDGDVLCISGSTPPGVPDDFYAALVLGLRERGVHVLVDTSGESLRLALEARPWAASPNAPECASALGVDENPRTLVTALAEQVDHAMVTLGSEGLLYAHGPTVWQVSPPHIDRVNAVGSGDAFVAGFLAGITRGLPDLEAVRLGVACGASNAARFEPGIGELGELEHLSRSVRVEPLDSIQHPP